MGFAITASQLNLWLTEQLKTFDIYAPKRFEGGGRFSGTDCIRYGKITDLTEIVFDRKASYSFKEVLTPVSQTLFYFTENEVKEPEVSSRGAVILLRSCDIHALKRLDDMYLNNGPADYYYRQLRQNIRLVLIGCAESFDSCFCVSMNTSRTEAYDMCINVTPDGFAVDCKNADWESFFINQNCTKIDVTPDSVQENRITVQIPQNLTAQVASADMWDEYTGRCINCGRCNFVCPTCTCFTMQDLYYSENAKVGERRRVWASCMVDGYTDVAGGGSYRKRNGERMRFKVLHKVLDYKKRNGQYMCVGCGRCDDICPEYISFSACVSKLEQAMKEVSNHDTK